MELSELIDAEWVDVVVVGAGVSGIGTAWAPPGRGARRQLHRVEAAMRIGGTWDLFRYPGVRSDSDVQTYAYAFKPWTSPDTLRVG